MLFFFFFFSFFRVGEGEGERPKYLNEDHLNEYNLKSFKGDILKNEAWSPAYQIKFPLLIILTKMNKGSNFLKKLVLRQWESITG